MPDFINEIKLANAVPYAASKAALNTLFAKLNAAYADEGILFMSLCPGYVATAEGGQNRKCANATGCWLPAKLTLGP